MTPNGLRSIAQIATAGILNTLLSGIAVALLAWAVTLLFARRGAGTRFAVWFFALVAIATLPWFWRLGVIRGYAASGDLRSVVTLPTSMAVYLFLGWLVGAAFGMIRVGVS